MSDVVSGRRWAERPPAQVEGRSGEAIPEEELFLTVEIRHCVTYIPEGDQWVVAPGQQVEVPISVPVNVDVPLVTPPGTAEVGAVLNCTMGNWEGEPTSYEYRWASDGMLNAGIAPDYVAVAGDVGKAITCTVTATNGGGSTTAPPSTAVTITEPAAGGLSAGSGQPVNQARARREQSLPLSPAPQPSADSV